MVDRKNSEGGYDSPVPNIAIHEPPASLVALREELSYHPEIVAYASQGAMFEDVLGKIALQLDILVDGLYDVGDFCAMLTTALRARRLHSNISITDLIRELVPAEIHEKADTLEIVERPEESLQLPEDAVVVTTKLESEKIANESEKKESEDDTTTSNLPDAGQQDTKDAGHTSNSDGETSGSPERN